MPSNFSEIILGNALRINNETVLTVPEGHARQVGSQRQEGETIASQILNIPEA
jgi:hypothetical protein